MNQRKYLVYAVLLLLVVAGGYFVIQKFSQTKIVENYSLRIIDYEERVDSLSKLVRDGKMFFMRMCASCHHIFKDGFTGALIGVEFRWPEKKELFAFIRNPAAVTARNAYARKLKEKSVVMMTAFPDLTDKEIQTILDYIKSQEKPQKIIY